MTGESLWRLLPFSFLARGPVVQRERKRNERGWFTPEAAGEEATEPVKGKPAAVGAPRPRQCRAYARRRLAEAAPALVDALLKEAEGGSVQHLKSLMELSGITKEPAVAPVKRRRRGKTLARQLLEKWGVDGPLGGKS